MRNKSMLGWLGVGLISGLLLPIQVLGQVAIGTSRIYGNISDPSGAAVPGATVRITEQATSAVRTVMSGSDGVYVAPDLKTGAYDIEVEASGFKILKAVGIVVHTNENLRRDIQMEVGSVTSSVEVSGRSSMVDTYTSALSQTVSGRQVVDLPLSN